MDPLCQVLESRALALGPGATMGVGLFVEQVTSQQKCLGLKYLNIMCPLGGKLSAMGLDIVCGEGPIEDRHDGCTATLPPGGHILEYTAAENIAEDLYLRGILVIYLVTDSHGQMEMYFKMGIIMWMTLYLSFHCTRISCM